MTLEMEDRGKALEDEYFHRQEQELLAKMKAKLSQNSSEPTLDCPKCDGKLKEIGYENIQIDACDKCGGIWLDAGELAQVIHKDEHKSGWLSRMFE
jgi:uncharacterized protein